jgi:hypothetical protein
MTRKGKIVLASSGLLVILAVGAALLSRGSSGSSLGQTFNAQIDNLEAAGIRLLELPVIFLVAGAAVLGVIAALPVMRWGTRSGKLTAARIGLAALVGALLISVAIAVDYKISRLQAEVADLRGQLNHERLAQMQGSSAVAAANVSAAAPEPPRAAATSPGTPSTVKPANTPTTPATPATPAAAAKSRRDVLMVDVVQVPRNLSVVFGQVGFHPMIHDEATDIVEVDMLNGPVIAYMAVVNLRTPGLEVKFGGSLTQKTLTSDFAKSNNCQIAINGEAGQSPQANSGLGNWRGYMMVTGQTLMSEVATNKRPFLSFDKSSRATFTAMSAADRMLRPDAYNVIWGRLDAVVNGKVQTENERDRQPRTAMGINADGSKLYLMVVDGRQQRYSVGFTRAEVGAFLQIFGATNGMLCDEGGSSCMYVKKFNKIINSPSDGVERPTYTHFGISLKGE